MSDKKTVIVEAAFTAKYTFEFEVPSEKLDNERYIIERLCNKDIFTSFSDYGVGLNEHVLREYGIRATLDFWDGDPSPTGAERFRRDWEIYEKCGGEE
jgi:hypothetical protein